jgi:serine/threonine protein kinase
VHVFPLQVILGLVYDQKIDLWSLGCVLAELFTGEVLFKNDSEQTLLARIIATIGACYRPRRWHYTRSTDRSLSDRAGPIPAPLLADRPDLQKQFAENPLFALDAAGNGALAAVLLLPPLEQAVQASDAQFLAFLRALLQLDPAARPSAAQARTHPWLQHGVFSGTRT